MSLRDVRRASVVSYRIDNRLMPSTIDFGKPTHVIIRVQGRVAPSWSDYLGGATIACCEEEGTPITTLTGVFRDQAALFGALNGLYGLGHVLLSVQVLAEPV